MHTQTNASSPVDPLYLRANPASSRSKSSSPTMTIASPRAGASTCAMQPTVPVYEYQPVSRIKRSCLEAVTLFLHEAVSTVLSWSILLVITTIAFYQTRYNTNHDSARRHIEDDHHDPQEEITQDESYYARRWGYISENYEIVTSDGYVLRMHRVTKGQQSSSGSECINERRPPVLLGHGLFQCSGAFVLNEERSLAFALADQGYDVWMGNTRATGSLHHVSLSHKDPEYWAWGLKELGAYDWTCQIDFVCQHTGFDKVAYIGHSQGNAMAFVGLKLRPEYASKLTCFIALAPAVFSGTLVSNFPLRHLIALNSWLYSLIFGRGGFIPIMQFAQDVCHPVMFSHMAYCMFSYLFSWWDHHWLRRRKPKYFQFTPRPVSARLIFDWIEGWGKRSVCLYATAPPLQSSDTSTPLLSDFKDTEGEHEDAIKVPLAVFYGTDDYLVDGERFVRTFEGYEDHGMSQSPMLMSRTASGRHVPPLKSMDDEEAKRGHNSLFPMLRLVLAERINGYEHMDTIWAHDNHETTYPGIFHVLESTTYTA